MSDIVERLREYRRADPYRKSALMAAEAADEIESLHSRLVIESKAREALLRENESLRSRLAEEARRHTEQTVELVNLAEGRRVRLAEAEALLRDIAEMRVTAIPSMFMDESMAAAARAYLSRKEQP